MHLQSTGVSESPEIDPTDFGIVVCTCYSKTRSHKQSRHMSPSHVTVQIVDINALPDPCPLPHTIKKRGLNDKERLLYAPMADVGGLLYDKDAVYIDIPDWKVRGCSSLLAALQVVLALDALSGL